ncbi:MAG: RNA polymerase sigma-70 factor [Bacteroidetes bacterium]|nr:MAG: RNA polymerase sigma-70 factor [Bacteroidota bacterium]
MLTLPNTIAQPSTAQLSQTQAKLSDEDLLAAIQNGNRQAFKVLFHRYYESLCHQANAIIRCEHQAEEIVSDIFIKVWKNRQTLNITTKMRYYLYTAVRNQSVDYLRKHIRERNYKGELTPDHISLYHCPDEVLIGEELRQRIENAIAQLPPQGRRIFQLSRDEGMKYREIAEHLQLSIKTVETHMRRSLIHLRACLLK